MDRRNTSQSESTRTGTIATVELPATLLERVEARVPRSEFDSTEEYVAFVLEEVLARVEDETDGGGDYDAVDQDEVETRLKSLGYLD